MLALHVAVVRRDEDVRVVEPPLGAKRPDDSDDPVVDRAQRGAAAGRVARHSRQARPSQQRAPAQEARFVGHVPLVEARRPDRHEAGRPAGVARSRAHEAAAAPLDRPVLVMWRQVGEREEQRPSAGSVDRRERVLGEHVGLVETGVARERPSVGPQAPVVVEPVAPHAVGRVAHSGVPSAPARRDLGRIGVPIAVQELADVRRPVARPAQPHGQRVRLVEPAVAAARRVEPHHAMVVGVAAGEEGRTRRTADRIRRVGAGKGHPPARNQATGGGHR